MATAFNSLASASAYPKASMPVVAVHNLQTFETESAAQAHCPNDIVVWLNTKTGIWHEKGSDGMDARSTAYTSVARRLRPQAIGTRGAGSEAFAYIAETALEYRRRGAPNSACLMQ